MNGTVSLSGAERIKRLRRHLNLTQRELAEEFHVTHGAVGLWENGEREVQGPGLRLLEVFEEELGLQVPRNSGLQEIDEIIVSRFSRNLNLTKLASKAFSVWASHLVRSQFTAEKDLSGLKKKSYVNLAKEVIDTFSEMKGLPMKLGQIISYHQINMPNEVREMFQQLQTTSFSLSQKAVAQIVKDELGENPKHVFAKWCSLPFAAASIGQVHFAKLKSGESAAVKIQYPGIGRTIRSDLKNMEFFTKIAKLVFGPTDAPAIVKEMAERFSDECDYYKEAESQEFFKIYFQGRNEFIVPKVYKEYSKKSILCTEFIEGQSFEHFVASSSQPDKNRVGEILWQFYFESIFKAHRMNADPHPGNYLIKDQSVVFLDFGCSSHYSSVFVSHWKIVLLCVMKNDEKRMIETLKLMGMIPGDQVDSEQLREIVKALYEPYLHQGVYTFNHDYVKKVFRIWFLSSRSRQNFIFRSEWIFLTRILFGLSSILAMLGAQADWRSKMLHLLESDNYQPMYNFKAEKKLILPTQRQ